MQTTLIFDGQGKTAIKDCFVNKWSKETVFGKIDKIL
jgi:hypothetical protein